MADDFDPYYEWLGIPPKDQPPHHYRLLGIEVFEQNLNVIERAADRQMGHVRSFQTGQHSKASQRLLNEISAAKVCLLNPQRKADYDAQLQQQIVTKSVPEFSLQAAGGMPDLPPALPEAIPVLLPSPDAQTPAGPDLHLEKSHAERTRTSRRPKKTAPWILIAVPIVALLGIGGGLLLFFQGKGKTNATQPSQVASSGESNPEKETTPVLPVMSTENPSANPTVPDATTGDPATTTPTPETSPSPIPVAQSATINEANSSIEDPPAPAAAPAVPQAVEESIVAAAGIRDDRFVFCQTLAWEQFADVHGALRKEGYRLSRFRPYRVQEEIRVAAIWLRDGLPSRLVSMVDSSEITQADQRLREQGFVPVDLAGIARGTNEVFSAVWVKPNSPVGETAMTFSVTFEEYKPTKEKMLEKGFLPVVHHVYYNLAGVRKYCDLWIATPHKNQFTWTGDRDYAARQILQNRILADLHVVVSPRTNAPLLAATQWLGLKDNFTHFVGLSPEELKRRGAERAAAGDLPCSLSIASGNNGELVGVAVWRPANQLYSPIELANLPRPAETPATPEVAPRALRFTGQGSVELRDSAGLANISRDFTLEMSLRFDEKAFDTANILFGTGAYRGLHPEVGTMAMKGWLVGIRPAATNGTAKSQFILQWAESSGQIQNHVGELPPFDTQWHHLAVCNRAASTGWELVVYVDGVESYRASNPNAKDAPSPVGVYLGRPSYVPGTRRALQGLVRACRLSSGIRYASNFQPPDQLSPDDQTLALLDFSGADSALVADLSGNQRNGQMNGVVWTDLDGNLIASTNSIAGGNPTTTEKLPPPASSDGEVVKIREVFKEEIATAKEPVALIALAEKLLSQALEEQDPAIRYALFVESRRLAVEGADWAVASRSIDEQYARFNVDPWGLRAETFNALTKKVKAAPDRKILADTAVAQAETAVGEGACDAAESLLTSASTLAPRGERDLVKQINELRKRVSDEKKIQQVVADARTTLTQSPEDATANESLGKYLCFTKEDWETGIRHLAKGPEGRLANAARQDATQPIDANERMTVAEAWAEVVKSSTDALAKAGAASRALHWYQLALPDLAGVKKLQAEKQIEELSKTSASSHGKIKFPWLEGEPGVAMELRGHASDVTCVAIARSGRFLVSGSDDGTIRIWDLATGKQAGQITPGGRDVRTLLLSPDDRSIAAPVQSRGNYSIGVWSVQNGQPIGSVNADGPTRHVAGSQDWRRVAYAKMQSGQQNLLVYNLATLTPVAPLNCPGTPVSIAVSRSGRYLAAADDNNTVFVWDLQTGKALLPLTGHADQVQNLSFSPNERQLMSSSFRTVIIWDLAKGAEERRMTPTDVTGAVGYSPDGNRVLMSPNSTEITIYSAKDGSQVTRVRARDASGPNNNCRSIVCTPDGRAAATISYNDAVIRIWRLPQP